jgi:asparagine synthase (glutamine-hydrolysing)
MCGICGTINFNGKPVKKNKLEEINNLISHRGPDDNGIYLYKNSGIAHRRLSIIDLNSGQQPLTNENNSIWITFNGEIYNYPSLKKNLLQKGHIFRTNTDTEVIIHLYEEFGNNFVSKLEGMFAFAILDQQKEKLILVRDRMGQKPLYYTLQNDVFVFASELQAIVKHPEINKEINPQSLHDFLTLQYIPAPNTIYKKINKLLPASILEINLNEKKFNIKTYWHCAFNKKLDISYEDAKSKLKDLMIEATKKRLMADVPLGTFLSGGIDSTIITGIISEITDSPVKTFTIGFEDSKYDERNYAAEAAGRFNTDHNIKIVNPKDFSILESLIKNYGEPYADSSMLPTFFLSKFARKKVTVALTGDGADELFAGYYRYLAYKYSTFLDILPITIRKFIQQTANILLPEKTEEKNFTSKIHRILKMVSSSKNKRYLNTISRTNEREKLSLYGNHIKNINLNPTQNYFNNIAGNLTAENSIEKLMELDMQTYLPYDILTKIDIASMSNSLELRSPFMDHKLIEFVNSLPLKYKQSFSDRKKILKDSFSDIIPDNLRNRKKMGFGVPISSWLKNEWKNKSNELILDGNGIKNGYFSKKDLSTILLQHQNNKTDNSYLIWSLMIFELWYNQFMR